MKILALGHRKRVGKDTVAGMMLGYLASNYPELRVVSVGLADTVKDRAYKVFKNVGLMPKEYYDAHEDKREEVLPGCGYTPRQIWIRFAEICREIDPYCWIHLMLDVHKDVDVIIVRDMRTQSEWEVFNDFDCVKIRIENPKVPPSTDAIDHYLDAFPFDLEIMNNKTKEVLEAKVHKLLGTIMKGWYGPTTK